MLILMWGLRQTEGKEFHEKIRRRGFYFMTKMERKSVELKKRTEGR